MYWFTVLEDRDTSIKLLAGIVFAEDLAFPPKVVPWAWLSLESSNTTSLVVEAWNNQEGESTPKSPVVIKLLKPPTEENPPCPNQY